jgi:hypothetical protein
VATISEATMKGASADPSPATTWTSRLLAAEYIRDSIAESCKKTSCGEPGRSVYQSLDCNGIF